jgi:hypothetical protein
MNPQIHPGPGTEESVPMPDETSVRERLGRQIKDSEAFRARSLPLAVLASVVGTVFASAFNTDRVGTLLTAATGPLITALFTTQGRMKARGVGIALVTLVALAVTVTGFTIPELIGGGKALIANRHGTFVPSDDDGSASSSSPSSEPSSSEAPPSQPPPTGAVITTSTSSLTCADTVQSQNSSGTGTCPPVEVRNDGTAEFQITGTELTGPSASEFNVTTSCTGALAPGASCRLTVEFHPAGTGPRQAVLLIHQDLPGPANRVALQGTGILSTVPPGSPAPAASDPVALASP